MFQKGCNVYLLIPDGSSERVLHPGIVSEVQPNNVVIARFEEPINPQVGAAVFLHAEVKGKFMQQAGSVQAYLQALPHPVYAFQMTGQPISAESRSVFRVSVAVANLKAAINNSQEKCPLLDVSATGFSVISSARLRVGDEVEATVEFNKQKYSGRARMQSIRILKDGRTRYGFHALEVRSGSRDNLQKGLGQISAAVQREQLRRLARA